MDVGTFPRSQSNATTHTTLTSNYPPGTNVEAIEALEAYKKRDTTKGAS